MCLPWNHHYHPTGKVWKIKKLKKECMSEDDFIYPKHINYDFVYPVCVRIMKQMQCCKCNKVSYEVDIEEAIQKAITYPEWNR